MAAEPSRDSFWQTGRGSESRLLLIARPTEAVRCAIAQCLSRHGPALGPRAFPAENWHQSLSDRYVNNLEMRQALTRTAAKVHQPAFTLELDRLRSTPNHHGSFHWEVRQRRKSDELTVLVEAINEAAVACRLHRGGGHSPHVTVHYRATGSLMRDEPIVPIRWTIDAIELVVGGGRPYHYETLDRWPLQPEMQQPLQGAMF